MFEGATISVPANQATKPRVHGEHIRISCPNCRGGASLAAVNGGIAESDGCWYCDDCEACGHYDVVESNKNVWRVHLRVTPFLKAGRR